MAATEMELLGTTIVHPSPSLFSSASSFDATLHLSHLDTDRNLDLPFRTLRLYSPVPSITSDPSTVITEALSKALFHYFPLAGTLLRRPSDSRLELRLTAGQGGVVFTRASSPLTLASILAHQPGSPLLDRLAPDPVPGVPLSLQVTHLECGGFALGMCVHHALLDGAGATQFLSAVAALARGADRPEVLPVWDRAALLGPRTPPRVAFPFDDVLGFDYRDVAYENTVPSVRECYHVSNACMDRFRARLAEDSSGSTFTTFESLGAFIWRAKVKAAGIRHHGVVKLVYSMNIKKLVKNPSLPLGYWGNVCVPVYVRLRVEELLGRPVWETARLIKRSKNSVTEEYVRSYIDFQEVHYGKGITAGEGVSAFTDWRHLGHGEADFGWGGPVVVWPLSWKLLGSVEPCFFLPYDAEDGRKEDGFKVLVSLPESGAEAFRLDMEVFKGEACHTVWSNI